MNWGIFTHLNDFFHKDPYFTNNIKEFLLIKLKNLKDNIKDISLLNDN